MVTKKMLDRISAKADKLTGQDNMIELDPNNPHHREWFEDKYAMYCPKCGKEKYCLKYYCDKVINLCNCCGHWEELG
jgi:hypothetical protein